MMLGDARALQCFEFALRLNPRDFALFTIQAGMAGANFFLGHLEECGRLGGAGAARTSGSDERAVVPCGGARLSRANQRSKCRWQDHPRCAPDGAHFEPRQLDDGGADGQS
jgi:hypothetical protein